ncbi:MAG: hypothetical protein HQM00_03305 [Magnetococcales bacterium]|nr:hypothetical protein [Magnetococcales bacterium]
MACIVRLGDNVETMDWWNICYRDRHFLFWSLLFACAMFFLVSLGFPVQPGIDFSSYLNHFYHLSDEAMVYRTGGSSLLIGLISQQGYAFFVGSIVLLYLLFLVAVYGVASPFGVTVARVTMVLMVLHVLLTTRMHFVDGDTVLIVGVAVWAWLAMWLLQNRSLLASGILGLSTVGLVLIKPTGLLFLGYGLYPLLCHGFSWLNFRRSLVFVVAGVVGVLGVATYNHVRYDRFMVADQANATFPAISLFRTNHLFARENGPHSQRLFDLVQVKLIDTPHYQAHRIDIHTFFSRWDPVGWGDFSSLDRFDPGVIRKAALEAIARHPGKFLLWSILYPGYQMFVATSLKEATVERPFAARSDAAGAARPLPEGTSATIAGGKPPLLTVGYNSLPQIIAELNADSLASQDPVRVREIQEVSGLLSRTDDYYHRSLHFYAAQLVESLLTPVMPPMLLFLVLALFGLRRWRDPHLRALLLMVLIAVVVVIFSSMVDVSARYRVPFDLLFILAGVVGLACSGLPAAMVRDVACSPLRSKG